MGVGREGGIVTGERSRAVGTEWPKTLLERATILKTQLPEAGQLSARREPAVQAAWGQLLCAV